MLKGLGIKIDAWENPVVYASTRDWSGMYGAIRSEPETAAQSSFLLLALLLDLSVSGNTRAVSACIVVGAVTVTRAENFVSPLSESSPPHKHQKKKVSVAARQSVHQSGRSPTLPSSSGLCVLQIENERLSTVGEVSQPLHEGHRASASKSTGWPRQRCTKSPRLRQLAE